MLHSASNHSIKKVNLLNSNRNSSSKNSVVKPAALLFYQPTQNGSSHQSPSIQNRPPMMNHQNSVKYLSRENSANSSRTLLNMGNPYSGMQKQNNISLNNNSLQCYNHRNICAEYVSCTTDGQEIYYCQKCARLLVDQGFDVTPICEQPSQYEQKAQRFPYYTERCGQIKEFQKKLQEIGFAATTKVEQLKEILVQSQEFYGQQIQEISNYFEEVIQQLEFQKNKCYNHILKERSEAEQYSRNLMKSLMDYQKELAEIETDIQENIDEVYTVQYNNYEMVLNSFKEKVETIEYQLFHRNGGIAIKDIEFRKIDFMGVPDSINSLSEIILKSCGSDVDASGGLLGSMSINDDTLNKMDQNQASHAARVNKNSSLMFSFDGEKMKSYTQLMSQGQINGYEDESETIRCRNQKQYTINGIKQVELSDGIQEMECDDQLLYCQEGEC